MDTTTGRLPVFPVLTPAAHNTPQREIDDIDGVPSSSPPDDEKQQQGGANANHDDLADDDTAAAAAAAAAAPPTPSKQQVKPSWNRPASNLSARERRKLNVSLMNNTGEFDVLLGCVRCCHSREGCVHCQERPTMMRRRARWKPSSARPQKAFCKTAPTFYPTEEEFALGPIGYLEKVYATAAPYGILCVVPPPSWNPPFVLDRYTTSTQRGGDDVRFPTRVQSTSKLQRRGPHAASVEKAPSSSSPTDAAGAARAEAAAATTTFAEHNQQPENGVHKKDPDAGSDTSDSDTSDTSSDQDPKEFGFAHGIRTQSLRSFRRYCDWMHETHFEGCSGTSTLHNDDDGDDDDSKVNKNAAGGAHACSSDVPSYAPTHSSPTTNHDAAEPSSKRMRTPSRKLDLYDAPASMPRSTWGDKPDRAALEHPPPTEILRSQARESPTIEQVEGEFWRIVEEPTDEMEVLYGADLHTALYGSGFPGFPRRGMHARGTEGAYANEKARTDEEQVEDHNYSTHLWNVNMFPMNPSSVLRHVDAALDIPGVTVPWLYFGSVLTSFSWHIEDHALCSVNYIHFGAPKVWYGVPGHEAGAFESAMRKIVPGLFDTQKHLLYSLTTMVSPQQLHAHGVTVSRVICPARCFVITLPNAYHGGINVGMNGAESVNFAPPLWLPWGLDVLKKYKVDSRAPSMSYDQLLITLAKFLHPVGDEHPYDGLLDDPIDQERQEAARQYNRRRKKSSISAKPIGAQLAAQHVLSNHRSRPPASALRMAEEQLRRRVEEEEEARNFALADVGVVTMRKMRGGIAGGRDPQTSVFRDTAERDCAVCAADLYLSAVVCTLHPHRAVCPAHADKLCLFRMYGDHVSDDGDGETSDVEDDMRCPCNAREHHVLLYRHASQELRYRCGLCRDQSTL